MWANRILLLSYTFSYKLLNRFIFVSTARRFRLYLLIPCVYLYFSPRGGVMALSTKLQILRCVPIFGLSFPESLLKFEYRRPAFDPLFRLPPNCATRQPNSDNT